MRRFRLSILLSLAVCIPAFSQSVPKVSDFGDICDSLNTLLHQRTTVYEAVRLQSVKKSGSQLNLYFSSELSYYPWRKKDEVWFREFLEKHFAETAPGFSLGKIFTNNYELGELVTPELTSSGAPQAYSRMSRDPRRKTPRFIREVGARQYPKGLTDRYIALWQSHGLYYSEEKDMWRWQRATLHRTVEDMFTQSFVLPFLIPMLENSGAYVMTPRERDIQWREIITDNDKSFEGPREGKVRRSGNYVESGEWEDAGEGFADFKETYVFSDNPFKAGTARMAKCRGAEPDASIKWVPDIEERGEYAVYVSYKTLQNSSESAHYTVRHMGGESEFLVNQKRGGGTWIYLGTFEFDKGEDGYVALDNSGTPGTVVTADAVKIGGGMGKLERGGSVSGFASSVEGAHYWMQWAGVDSTITRRWDTDYTNDYASRGAWTAMMKEQKNIPFDLSLAFHTDAGATSDDSIVGTLAIYTLRCDGEREFPDGRDRSISRLLCDYVQSQVVDDIRADFNPAWSRRGIWDKSYSESRTTGVPAMILELLSHQNFADMKFGLDPSFRFTACRAVYKGILKALSEFYGCSYVVQPLPVNSFSATLSEEGKVKLSWKPTADSKEPTAEANGYIVYTRIDGGAFDEGVEVESPEMEVEIERGHIYSFKVEAFNDGGKSFPSEVLSAGLPLSGEKNIVLIVNNFDRLSAPSSSDGDFHSGFDDSEDSGVPYIREINYIGENYAFDRSASYQDDDDPGFGASYSDHAGEIIAGNTFDFPYVHGKALLSLGYPFCSMSRDAFVSSEQTPWALDLICGKQGTTRVGTGMIPDRYQVFPEELQGALRRVSQAGGNLLVSGSNIASDNLGNYPAQAFASNVLGYRLASSHGTHSGEIGKIPFSSSFNEDIYCVENPDALAASAKGAKVWMHYPRAAGAAVYYTASAYKAVSIGVPLETILKDSDREFLFKSVMDYFEGGSKPESRR